MNRYQITGIIYIQIGMNEWLKRYTWEFPPRERERERRGGGRKIIPDIIPYIWCFINCGGQSRVAVFTNHNLRREPKLNRTEVLSAYQCQSNTPYRWARSARIVLLVLDVSTYTTDYNGWREIEVTNNTERCLFLISRLCKQLKKKNLTCRLLVKTFRWLYLDYVLVCILSSVLSKA